MLDHRNARPRMAAEGYCQSGFTLVEVSIVLVVIGILVGGVLLGQSMIRSAELRSVMKEYKAFSGAVETFRDKYRAYPGDMANATSFWERPGGGNAQCGDPAADTGTGMQTCNGDGNGRVGEWGSGINNSAIYYETFRFWQHLVNAGLIEGKYSGIHGPASHDHSVVGENVPPSAFSEGGWCLEYLDLGYHNPAEFSTHYGNYFSIGAKSANNAPNNPAFTPKEAYDIDMKMDDGKPATGKVKALWWNNNCTNAANGNDVKSDYKVTDTDIHCMLAFTEVF